MLWVRKVIGHVLAIVLLLALLGGALSVGFKANFGHPDTLESWLNDSKIYDRIVDNAIGQAQSSGSTVGNVTSISLQNTSVRLAAKESFSPQLLKQYTDSFIDSNFAWLNGKSAKPTFNIDLSQPKQNFAQKIGQLVKTKLASLPACTPAQLAQIQIPTDPLTVSCRPPMLDPTAEGKRISQEISSSDFLSNSILTADSLSPNKQGGTKPYYENWTNAPAVYRLILKLPLICAAIAIVSMLAILAIARTRRRGLRRIGWMLLVAGAILLVIKLLSDTLVVRLSNKATGKAFTGQLKQPYDKVLHTAEASLTQSNLRFGIAFIVLAVIIFAYLLFTRQGSPRASRESRPAEKREEVIDTADEAPVATRQPAQRPSPYRGSDIQPPRQMGVTGPPRIGSAKPIGPNSAPPNIKKRPRSRGPRLIQ